MIYWIAGIWDWLVSDWSTEKSFLRSLMFPLVVGGVSAFSGTLFASRLTAKRERLKKQEDLLGKLLGASALLAYICNSAVSLKAQHTLALATDYSNSRKHFLSSFTGETKANAEVTIPIDLQHLSAPELDGARLVQTMVEVGQFDLRNLLAANALSASIENLSVGLNTRNNLITEFRVNFVGLSIIERATLYYGLHHSDFGTDTRYKSSVEIIAKAVDDVIFFSRHIYKRVLKDAIEAKSKLPSAQRSKHPILAMQFSASHGHLLPDESAYTDWTSEPAIRKKMWFRPMKGHELELLDRI